MSRALKAVDAAPAPHDKLAQLILDGELPVGSPLVERALADRLGVSRTPVREAIFRLEREGLVQVVEGRGAFVASYTIDDLIEIYQMREGLEPVAARLSCPHLSDRDLEYHEKQLKRYRADPKLREQDPGDWRRLGRDFHNMFIYGCNNNRLIRVMESMRNQVELFRGLGRVLAPRDDMKTSIEEHWEILQAFKKRDAQRAENSVRLHLENGLRKRLDALHDKRL
jgi:DNA-binding GntR family transcriptional regulator